MTATPSEPFSTPASNTIIAACSVYAAVTTIAGFVVSAGFGVLFPAVIACICAGWAALAWRIAPVSVPLSFAAAFMTTVALIGWLFL